MMSGLRKKSDTQRAALNVGFGPRPVFSGSGIDIETTSKSVELRPIHRSASLAISGQKYQESGRSEFISAVETEAVNAAMTGGNVDKSGMVRAGNVQIRR